ncbi:hypothetical protein BDP27DRAFT_1413667 [Rhodocollybia butyracea]|uniref:Uncharacterized protein n=1 Tax=Rhodocollybia butyracea TaxID=206335 RepID=A0A9P5Q933_9AGAR|nr:hypothetical protein BDP27DRAFT_1413667 [Rhodocollybia butyracea]
MSYRFASLYRLVTQTWTLYSRASPAPPPSVKTRHSSQQKRQRTGRQTELTQAQRKEETAARIEQFHADGGGAAADDDNK